MMLDLFRKWIDGVLRGDCAADVLPEDVSAAASGCPGAGDIMLAAAGRAREFVAKYELRLDEESRAKDVARDEYVRAVRDANAAVLREYAARIATLESALEAKGI